MKAKDIAKEYFKKNFRPFKKGRMAEIQLIHDVIVKSLENARLLAKESKLLLRHKCYGRANALSIIGMEELAKGLILKECFDMLTQPKLPPADRKKIDDYYKLIKKHSPKIEKIIADLFPKDKECPKHIRNFISQRERSFYVDFDRGKKQISDPNDGVPLACKLAVESRCEYIQERCGEISAFVKRGNEKVKKIQKYLQDFTSKGRII